VWKMKRQGTLLSWIPITKSKKINKDSNDGETEIEQRDSHKDIYSDDNSPGEDNEYGGDDSTLILTYVSVTQFATTTRTC